MLGSYDYLLKLTSDISWDVHQCAADGVWVRLLKLKSGPLTTVAVDIIDSNPTSATAKESL